MISERVRERAEGLTRRHDADGEVRIGANRRVAITSVVVGLGFLGLAVASAVDTPKDEWTLPLAVGVALAVGRGTTSRDRKEEH